MRENTKRLGTASIPSLLLILSLPSVVAMFVQSLYNVIDTFFIARLSSQAVGALTIVFPIQMIFVALGAGTGIGLNSYASRKFGEKDSDEASKAASQVFFLAVFFGTIVIILGRFFTTEVLTLFGATPTLLPLASQYFSIICFGTPFLLFNMMSNNLLRAQGDALLPMQVMMTGAICNIILDPLLIFGIGPFPRLEIQGAAVATSFSQFLGTIVCLYFLFRKTSYSFRKEWMRPEMAVLKNVYVVGLPAMLMQFIMSFVITVFNHVLGSFGDLAIAALGLSFRILSMFYMPVFGMMQGLMPVVGFNYGAKLYTRLWDAIKWATLIGFSFGLIALSIIQLFSENLIRIFTQDSVLINYAVPALSSLTLAFPLVAMFMMWLGTHQALGKGKEALFFTIARQIGFLVPLLLILPKHYGIKGVWMAMPLADSGGFIILLLAMVYLRKIIPYEDSKKVDEEKV